jgi:hypothetical protein
MAHPDNTVDFTSGSTADTTSFSSSNPARWIACYGAGSIVVKDNASTPASVTYTVNAGDVFPGEWTAFTSTTCSRIRMTSTNLPPSFGSAFSSTVPGNMVQAYVSGGAAQSAAFTAAIGYVYLINPSGATFAYTLPAISGSNDGQKIAVVNVSTGSTATVAAPTGSDNVGNCAGTATGATAAGPTGGNVKVYTANNQTKAWLVGI